MCSSCESFTKLFVTDWTDKTEKDDEDNIKKEEN